jgi:hypothetical protein
MKKQQTFPHPLAVFAVSVVVGTLLGALGMRWLLDQED